MTVVSTLQSRYREVMDRVARAAERSGRSPRDIFVVAVSKYADIDDIRELIELGHADFGESRGVQLSQRAAIVDEMLTRYRTMREVAAARSARLADLPVPGLGANQPALNIPDRVRWHMVGHLQRNKVPKVAPAVRLIHSVDSLRLVEELQAFGLKKDLDIDVLVQVNCSEEPQKYGCAVAAAAHLCEQIDLCANVHIRGLMTMAAYSENPEDSRTTFRRCAELFEDISKAGYGDGRFNLLSMGMTGDFEVAIEEGANIVRIGSALFEDPEGRTDHHDDPETDAD